MKPSLCRLVGRHVPRLETLQCLLTWKTYAFVGALVVGPWGQVGWSQTPTDLAQGPVLAAESGGKSGKRRQVLTCPEVRTRIGYFLDMHYLYRSFDNEISKRTFKRIFESFDPGKYYFTESDIQSFQELEQKIDDNILKSDCQFVFDIHKVFLTRVKERHEVIMKLLSKPFQFNVDEEIIVDRRKVGWAKDVADLNERWRLRIKFQVLNMKIADSEEKTRDRLTKRYQQILKTYEDWHSDDSLNLFINSFASSLDPHSGHLLPDDQEDFNIRLGNTFEGIGATLSQNDGYISVDALIPGGAAERDGNLRVGDKIIGVDPGDGTGMADVIDMDLSKAVRLIRGKKGTPVKLLVLRKSEKAGGSERLTFSIVRDKVILTAREARGDTMTVGGKKIGVIRLPSFYTDFVCRSRQRVDCQGSAFHTQREVKKLVSQKVDGIILDLRSNGGGDLHESIGLTGTFIPEGTVVQTVDRRRITRTQQDQDPSVLYSGPFAILINKQSASASEIVAGAIQDYGRGIIMGGEHSYGKATVQIVQELAGSAGKAGGAIKVTQSKFYRPSGRSNQERGVVSDIVIPNMMDLYDISEKENDYVLPWDSIKAAPDFRPLQSLASIIPKLSQMSAERIAKNQEFVALKERMEKFKLEKDKATASLKEEPKKDGVKKADAKSGKGQKEDVKELAAKDLQNESERDNGKENDVIRPSDIQLIEAVNVLADAIDLTKDKVNWVSNMSR